MPWAPSAQLAAVPAAPTPLIPTGLPRAIKQHEKDTKQHATISEEVLEAEVAQAPQHVYRKTPGEPTAEERRIHCLTHVPFRNWCSACVDGRLRDRKHAKTEDDKEAMAIVHFDICEPETHAGVDADGRAVDRGVKINVGVERRTGAVCTLRIRAREARG